MASTQDYVRMLGKQKLGVASPQNPMMLNKQGMNVPQISKKPGSVGETERGAGVGGNLDAFFTVNDVMAVQKEGEKFKLKTADKANVVEYVNKKNAYYKREMENIGYKVSVPTFGLSEKGDIVMVPQSQEIGKPSPSPIDEESISRLQQLKKRRAENRIPGVVQQERIGNIASRYNQPAIGTQLTR